MGQKTYGATFKQLREERGMTIKDTAKDIVSAQFLSRFEKENSSISFDNFSKLLIRLGVTLSDFFEIYQGESVEFVTQHLNSCLNKYSSEEDILRHALQDMPYDFRVNPELRTIVPDMLKLHLNFNLKCNWDITQELERVTEFLKRSDLWCELEWTVYHLTFTYFPEEMIVFRLKQVMSPLEKDDHYTKLQKEAQFQHLLDAIRYFSNSGNNHRAEWLINFMKEELAKPYYNSYIHPQLLLKMQIAYHYFRIGDERSHELAKQVMDFMTILETQFNMPVMATIRDRFFWNIQKVNKTGKDFI